MVPKAERVAFSPSALRAARCLAGLSLSELGRRLDVSKQFMQLLEAGDRWPSPELLERAAAVLGFAPAFFRCPLHSAGVVEHDLFFRSLERTTLRDREQARQGVAVFRKLIERLGQELRFPRLDLPVVRAATELQIERAALDCREVLDLGTDAPIHNVVRAVERAGIFVTDLRCGGPEIDAFGVRGSPPIIVRNTAKASTSRQRFDVAHEVGHMVLHRDQHPGDKQQELQAHRFAGAFLLPAEAFRREFAQLRGSHWSQLFALKARWGMSVQAIAKRAQQLDLLTGPQYDRLAVRFSRAGWRRYSEPEEPTPEHPELLVIALRELHAATGTTPQQVLDELGWSEPLLRRLCGDVVADQILKIVAAPVLRMFEAPPSPLPRVN